jgi:hypothetical protein
MPASYGIHPIINIAHLEKYQPSPAEFGNCPTKHSNCEDFEALPEYKVEKIITEQRKRSKNGQKIIQYLTQFKGYTADSDEWLTSNQLKNAPDILEQWRNIRERSTPHVDLCSKVFYGEGIRDRVIFKAERRSPKIFPYSSIKIPFFHDFSSALLVPPFVLFRHAYAILYRFLCNS